MPYYILSNESCVKNNEYKFGFSSKNKDELLKQYEKNKRVISNPFVLKWWENAGSLKNEKEIHKKLRNTYSITSTSGEWYKCLDLLYFMLFIDDQIKNKNMINENVNKVNKNTEYEKEINIHEDLIYEDIYKIKNLLINYYKDDDNMFKNMKDDEIYDELNNTYKSYTDIDKNIEQNLNILYLTYNLDFYDLSLRLLVILFENIVKIFGIDYKYISLKINNEVYISYKKDIDYLKTSDIYIFNKNNRQHILINYEIIELFDEEKIKFINEYEKKHNIKVTVNNSKYLIYSFLVKYIIKDIENIDFKKNIINNINNIIKEYISEMDNTFLKDIIKENNINIAVINDYKLPLHKINQDIELEIDSLYIPKQTFISSSIGYILENKEKLIKVYGKPYFINNLNVKNVNVKITLDDKIYECSIDDYIKNIKKLKKKS